MTHYITTTTSTPCAIDNSGNLFTHGTASFARVVLKNGAIISMPMGHIRVEGTPAQLAEVAHLVSDDYVSLATAVAAFGGAAPAVETATVDAAETTQAVEPARTARFDEITLACGAVIPLPVRYLTFKGTLEQEQHFADSLAQVIIEFKGRNAQELVEQLEEACTVLCSRLLKKPVRPVFTVGVLSLLFGAAATIAWRVK